MGVDFPRANGRMCVSLDNKKGNMPVVYLISLLVLARAVVISRIADTTQLESYDSRVYDMVSR